jgi:hypothetical protein
MALASVQVLGSLKLAVPMLAVLAAVIAVATVLEAEHGRAYAQWYVYQSWWFIILLSILGVNIFTAAVSRWPWKRHQTGFVITHAGLLVLLAGSIQTLVGGVDGRVTLTERQSTFTMILPEQSQLTVSRVDRPDERPYLFSFVGGPSTWSKHKTLDIGAVDGIGARVLRYFNRGASREEWIPDESLTGGPVVKFRIESPHGSDETVHMLADQEYGDETIIGPLRLQS